MKDFFSVRVRIKYTVKIVSEKLIHSYKTVFKISTETVIIHNSHNVCVRLFVIFNKF